MAVFAGVLVAACRSTPTPAPERPPETQAPRPKLPEPPELPEPPAFEWRHTFVSEPNAGLFAVVTAGTTLRKHPRLDSEGWRFDGRKDGVVKVIERGPEFIEVELDWPDDPAIRHCLLSPLGEVGLRMFVVESELADVTTTSHSLDLGPHAGLVIAPGVRVRDSEFSPSVTLEARIGELSRWGGDGMFSIDVNAPLADVGKVYAAIRVDSLREPLPRSAELTAVLPDDKRWLIHAGAITAEARGRAYGQSARERELIVFGVDCLQLAGRVEAKPSDGSGGGGCGDPHPLPWSERWTIPAGTPVTWRTGGDAGQIHHDVELGAAPRARGKRRCFMPPLGCGHYDALEICAPRGSVTHRDASEPPSWWIESRPRASVRTRPASAKAGHRRVGAASATGAGATAKIASGTAQT